MCASMLHGETEIIDPKDSSTPAERGSTQESAALLNQDMYDLEFEYEMARINFYFKQYAYRSVHKFQEARQFYRSVPMENQWSKTPSL